MDEKYKKYILFNLNNDKLLEISKKLEVNINGFRCIKIKNGILVPPKNLLLNELLKNKYKNKLEILLEDDSVSENIINEELTDSNIRVDNYKEQINILTKENDYNKQRLLKLKDISEKTRHSLKNIKKEKLILEEEYKKIKKENKKLIKLNEKYEKEFYSIKNKYEELKYRNKIKLDELNKKSLIVDDLKKSNEILKNQLDIFKKENLKLKKKERKKVIVFGEINSKEIIDIEKYEIHAVDVNEINDLTVDINDFDESWILSYKIQYVDKIIIEEKIGKTNLTEFSSYKNLRDYIKRE